MDFITNASQFIESLNLTLVYSCLVVIGIVCCCLVYFFGGDDGGLGDGGDSSGLVISPTGVAFFTTSLGAFGLILYHGFNMSALGSVSVSVVLSALAMVVFNYFFFKVFFGSGATVQAEVLEGVRGEVYTAIPVGGTGEIIYRDSRGRQKSPAREAHGQALAAGQAVIIKSALGATLVVEAAEKEG